MQRRLIAIAAAMTVSVCLTTVDASAIPVGSGVQKTLTKMNLVEPARRVCTRNILGQLECWVDRRGPITVCHWVRDKKTGRPRRDCY